MVRSGKHARLKAAELSHPVCIEVRGHAAWLAAEVQDLLDPVLSCPSPGFASGGRYGWERSEKSTSLCQVDEQGRLVTHAGLVPRIVDRLESVGYQVTVVDRTTWGTLTKALSSLPGEADFDVHGRAFLEAIRGNPRGQIRARSDNSMAWCISVLGRLHPGANIAVACGNRTRAKRLQRRVQSFSDRVIQLGPEIDWRQGRMMVSTIETFAHCGTFQWNVMVCTDIQSALAKRSIRALAVMEGQLRYFFRPERQRVGGQSQFLLEALFGKEIFREPDPVGEPAVVKVLFTEAPRCTFRRRKGTSRLDWKRAAIWHNDARNEVVAEIADAIRTKAAACRATRSLRTAILVESTEHGEALLRLLPGWSLAHDRPREPAILRLLGEDSRNPVGDLQVATFVRAERCGISADVVIRADGGQKWPLSPGSFPRLATRQADDVVLVDVVDAPSGEAPDEELQGRLAGYLALGWKANLPSQSSMSCTTALT